ncbi:unnamed protein product, partial [Porites evermanni]
MADKLSVSDSVTKVYQAARDGSTNLAALLKRLKPEQRKTALKTKTKDGSHFVTPLIIAAHNGHLNCVQILLKYGADIEARGTLKKEDEVIEGCTPLWGAAASGCLDVVRLLIERNADVDGRTSTGSTPLRAAAYVGHLDIVRCLVESGADVNARNVDGYTPLLVACHWGHLNTVTYLINKGAFIDLQYKDGDTALHEAVQRGHLKIVRELLALGASQSLADNRGLTPLLYACDLCSIGIVEHIINRPECTKEQRIDALELLGANIAFYLPRNTEKALSYMKRGMEERYEDLAHPLLKKKMEPVEAYQNRKESQTLEELALLEGDDHAISMEGLIIRERILGPDNPANLQKIRYQGAVLADSEEYELCIGLWQRCMEKAINCDFPIIKDLERLPALFGEMLQKGKVLRPNFIEDVFEILVAASEKQTEKRMSKNLQEGQENEELEKTLYCALYLLVIYIKVKGQNANMIDFLQRFLLLNPRTNDGNTLLHLVAWHETPFFSLREETMRSVCKLPCIETMKLILHAGCNVNAVNTEGNTPLHLAVKYKPAEPEDVEILREMLLLLLDIGADPKLENKNGQTPLDSCESDEARRILSEKGRLSAMNAEVGD